MDTVSDRLQGAFDREVFVQKIADAEQAPIPIPCDPDTAYPEYRMRSIGPRNYVYEAVRELFRALGYDAEHFGTAQWNPLGRFIRPGQQVLIKPNMVLHKSYMQGEDYTSVVTHPALIRAVVDYVYIALDGKGKVTIGDAPINSADFDAILRNMGLAQLRTMYAANGFPIEIADFRLYTMEKDEKGGIRNQRSRANAGEHIVARLNNDSMLTVHDAHFRNYRVTEYDGEDMPLRHNAEAHEYCIHRSVFEADVILSLPKIKTHHKAGYTCAMKNYIGINGSKDWLPHHRKGSAADGGDEYLNRSMRKRMISNSWDIRWKIRSPLLQRPFIETERWIKRTRHLVPFKDQFYEGSWYGNTTISRTVNDLNRVVLYADRNGVMQETPQRRILYLVDGIICGEGEGPMGATSKRCNMVVWGGNAYAVDLAVVTLMGFDHRCIDTLRICPEAKRYRVFDGTPADVRVRTSLRQGTLALAELRSVLGFTFVPPKGWKGHIELTQAQ